MIVLKEIPWEAVSHRYGEEERGPQSAFAACGGKGGKEIFGSCSFQIEGKTVWISGVETGEALDRDLVDGLVRGVLNAASLQGAEYFCLRMQTEEKERLLKDLGVWTQTETSIEEFFQSRKNCGQTGK